MASRKYVSARTAPILTDMFAWLSEALGKNGPMLLVALAWAFSMLITDDFDKFRL